MDYIIKFTGEVSWEGQANGLPDKIHAFLVFKEYNREVFDAAIETQTGAFLRMGAMFVQKDQGQIIELNKMPQDRIMVPMRWIVSMGVEVVNMVG